MSKVQERKDKTLSTVILTATLMGIGGVFAMAAPAAAPVDSHSDITTIVQTANSSGGANFSVDSSGGALGK